MARRLPGARTDRRSARCLTINPRSACKTASTRLVVPPLRNSTATVSPTCFVRMIAKILGISATGFPSTEVTKSPVCNPAFSAALSGTTCVTKQPHTVRGTVQPKTRSIRLSSETPRELWPSTQAAVGDTERKHEHPGEGKQIQGESKPPR
jgi:hypothetical protein